MKCFYHTRYRFYQPHLRQDLKFFMISDVHFSAKVSSTKLQAITSRARSMHPDYILLPGDIVDSLGHIASDSSLKRLTSWLEQLGTVAPVLLCLGNHDFYRRNPKHNNIFSGKRHWYSEQNQRYFKALHRIDNVHLLDDTTFIDDKVYVFGFTQTPEYYQFDRDENHSTSIFHPGDEDLDILLSDLNAIDQNLISNLPEHQIKIALIHSPIYLDNPQVAAKFSEFDFVVSGHMHNGVVPPIINDFWRSERGLLAPGKRLFPKGTRNNVHSTSDRNIILGAVSTIQSSAKPLTFLNGVFPVFIATLELTKNQTYARKPDVKHEYIDF